MNMDMWLMPSEVKHDVHMLSSYDTTTSAHSIHMYLYTYSFVFSVLHTPVFFHTPISSCCTQELIDQVRQENGHVHTTATAPSCMRMSLTWTII